MRRAIYLFTSPKWMIFELAVIALAVAWTDANSDSLILGSGLVTLGCLIFTWDRGYQSRSGWAHGSFAGPKRFVRYPLLLSRFLIVLGFLLVARRPFLYLVALVFLTPFYRKLASLDDDSLRQEIGPLADEYRAVVSGMVPQLLPVRLGDVGQLRVGRKFSWKRALLERPRFSLILITLSVGALLWQYVFIQRFLPHWQWRLVTVSLLSLGFVSFYFKRLVLIPHVRWS